MLTRQVRCRQWGRKSLYSSQNKDKDRNGTEIDHAAPRHNSTLKLLLLDSQKWANMSAQKICEKIDKNGLKIMSEIKIG